MRFSTILTAMGRWGAWGGTTERQVAAPEPQPVVKPAVAAPSVPTGCLDLQTFSATLGVLIEGGRSKDLRLQVLSLVDFREALAGKWQRLSGLMSVAIPAIARKHINADNDIFALLDAEVSLLAMPNRGRQQVRTCVSRIAQDVARQLFGDGIINGRRPQVIITSIAANEAFAADGHVNRQAINSAVVQAGAFLKPAPVEQVAQVVDLAAPHRATLAALMQEPSVAASISGRSKAGATSSPDWFDSQLDACAEAVHHAKGKMTGDTKLTLLWTPTWVTAQKRMGAFHARIVRQDEDGGASLESGRAYENATPVEILTLDRFIATNTAKELKSLHYSKQPGGLIMPIHWMSMAPRWRDCVNLPILDCPVAARRKQMKIEVFGISSALPSFVLNYMFEPIEALGCDVIVRLGLGDVGVMSMLRSVKAVGIDLAELGEKDRVGDDELLRRINHFRSVAKNYNLACFIWGVRRRTMITTLIDAGYSFINGPGIMCDLGHPALPQQRQRVA